MARMAWVVTVLFVFSACVNRGVAVSDSDQAWINIEDRLYWCNAKASGGPQCVKPRVEGGMRECKGLDPRKYNCIP